MISGEAIFITTGNPISAAFSEASSADFTMLFFVTGISSDSFGERVTLVVEVRGSAEEKIQNLEELVKEINIDNKHKPRAIVMLPRFVYTDSGKINRNETVKLIKR